MKFTVFSDPVGPKRIRRIPELAHFQSECDLRTVRSISLIYALVGAVAVIAAWTFLVFGITFVGKKQDGFFHAGLFSMTVVPLALIWLANRIHGRLLRRKLASLLSERGVEATSSENAGD